MLDGPRLKYQQAARNLLRETLFDAASELIAQDSWAATRMADVAAAAGVSRQTLYNEFGSRQGFAQALALHEAESFLAAVDYAIRAHADDPHAALAAGIREFLKRAANQPLIVAIVNGQSDDGLLPLVTNQAGPVLSLATERLAGVIGEVWPDIPDASVRLVADNVVRLGISHAAFPTGEIDTVADGLAELLGPYLDLVVNP